MANKKTKGLYYSYSPATQEMMVTTVNPKSLSQVENIMLDTNHYLQWDPKQKEVVGFFVLFVNANNKTEKFYNFPKTKDLKLLNFNNLFKQLDIKKAIYGK